jgi:hypothetical protein
MGHCQNLKNQRRVRLQKNERLEAINNKVHDLLCNMIQ